MRILRQIGNVSRIPANPSGYARRCHPADPDPLASRCLGSLDTDIALGVRLSVQARGYFLVSLGLPLQQKQIRLISMPLPRD
jgi:hypothetical protein